MTVSWDKNPELDVIGYEFYYGTVSKNYQHVVDVNNNTSCTISGLDEGTKYYFAVKAYNDKNLKSSYSEELDHTIPITPITQHTLDVAIVGSGWVSVEPDKAEYDLGQLVTMTATAAAGWEFSDWSGDIAGSANPINITMNDDKTVTANFEPEVVPNFTLTASIVGNGDVVLDPPGGIYEKGTVVQLDATAAAEWEFSGWTGDRSGSANPVTIIMDADKTVTANFINLSYVYSDTFDDYTVSSDPADWLDTGANNSMAENDSLFEVYDIGGEKVYGTASTQTNIHSHYMAGDSDSLSGYEYTGRMMINNAKGGIGVTFFSQYPNEDAYYRLRRYSSNAFHIAPHGTKVEGDTDTGIVPLPNVWYRFKTQVEDTGSQTIIRAKVWQQGNGEPADWQAYAVDTSSSRLIAGTFGLWSYYTGSKYWDDLTVTPLEASSLQYALIVDTHEGGSVKLDPPGGTYNEGTEVQLIATAASGWEFSGWTGDITGTTNPVFVAMNTDMYVTPTFSEVVVEIPKYSLTVHMEGSGSVNLDPAGGVYEQGAQVMLTASSEPGWKFNGWSGDLNGSDNPATIVITGDRSITANFSAIMLHTLDVATVGNGWVSIDPDQAEYDLGQLVTMTATADPGWMFTGWSGDLSGTSNPTALTISGDHQVTATFADGTQTYAEDFEAYNDGDDPVDWLDTAAKNSMTENDNLFEVYNIGGEKVYGTNSTQTNIHSHYVGGGSGTLTDYEYTGRMMITNSQGGIGVTFFSQFPNEDAYYRLRRYGSNAFHISPHGTKVTGDTSTGVTPKPNVWYRFKIQVEDTGSQTEIRAKVWQQGQGEPADWLVDCYDKSASRLTAGTFGIWSYLSGKKYWDDMAVVSLLP